MNDAIVSNSTTSGNSQSLPICPASGAATAYTFLRHTGFILDELSAQGLVLWLDEDGRWQWRWQGTKLKSARGFWAIGEAVVDAVMSPGDASPGRFPETFAILITIVEPE